MVESKSLYYNIAIQVLDMSHYWLRSSDI